MEQKYMNKENTNTTIEINKSEFIAYISRVNDEDEAKAFINQIKNDHKSANHNCSAYIIGQSAIIQKADDDGEPSGTAGVPILEVLKRESLYNVCVVVTRYFGGIKLGGGGLIRAYSSATSGAVQASGKVIEVMMTPVQVQMDYTFTQKFEHMINDTKFAISETIYTDKVTYTVYTPKDRVDDLLNQIDEITKRTHDYTILDDIVVEHACD